MSEIECYMCGACCIAYSISTLNKAAGVPCVNLMEDGRCGDYENRPQVCRGFKPDELCVIISLLPKTEKVKIITGVYK